MPTISFVFSFYNEQHTLPLLIRQVRAVMAGEPDDFEMIFVNDASTDNSLNAIEDEARQPAQGAIVVVNLSRRFGVEESFLAGLEAARGEAVILMYADLQDPPEVALQMIKAWREGVDVVHAVRRRRLGDPLAKKIAAFVAYRLIGKLADIPIPYDAGEFKLLSKKVAQHLLSLPEAEPYLRGLIPWIGFKQTYVAYDMPARAAGHSKIALFGKKAWTVFLNGIISFSDVPVYAMWLLGLGGILISLLGSVAPSTVCFLSGQAVLGPGIFFLWGTLMFALGWLGLYLLKIYKNTRGRPRYIVKDVRRLSP